MEVIMSPSLTPRRSLEQLKKLAKELVRDHGQKQPDALALIGRLLPALAGKSALEIAAYPFALHDAQSVVARQYGFSSWNELHAEVTGSHATDPAPVAAHEVAGPLLTALEARRQNDFALWSSVMSEQFNALVPKESFEASTKRMAGYLQAGYRLTYMGELKSTGRPVHFWRLWVPGWDSDLLVRMSLNEAGQICGLLFSPPFDTAMGRK
jgi:hypothetical protein